MKEAREFEAATEEEAVSAAARELGVKEAELSYEVMDGGAKGILGVGTRPAEVHSKDKSRSSCPRWFK